VKPRCGSGLAVPACVVGWSDLATRPRAVTAGERPEDPPARGDWHRARLGGRQGPQLQLLAQAGRRPSVYPADLRLALPGVSYLRAAVLQQYLEHGTGPLAAELDRLWRVRTVAKRRTERDPAGHDGDGWRALPRGAAGLVPRRAHLRAVTDLYYPGLQDPPGHDGRNAGSGP
jgi:hypothetical protein